MNHIAIMRKSWGLTEKILTGEKTAESRWHKTKRAPWDRIKSGDTVYFKDSGRPVDLKAKVTKVLQFDNLTPQKTQQILAKYGKDDLGISSPTLEIKNYISNKDYCILVFFSDVKRIKPFKINKAGFGAMSAWITIDDINKIKKVL